MFGGHISVDLQYITKLYSSAVKNQYIVQYKNKVHHRMKKYCTEEVKTVKIYSKKKHNITIQKIHTVKYN